MAQKLKSLSAIHTYPVKGCKGMALDRVEIGSMGPGFDRRWMIVDSSGRFLSQRQLPKMALIETRIENDHLFLSIPDHSEYPIAISTLGPEREVIIWRDCCLAIDQGDPVGDILSQFLEVDCRLVFMPETTFRQVNPAYAVTAQDSVSFADGYPFLLISEASLQDLNQRLLQPVEMNRFRPNLVISGCEPYEEDTWDQIRIGTIRFKLVKPCSRCVVITVDQATGEKEGVEPLQTLATYRKQEKGIMFGQNLIHVDQGTLFVGEPLEVLQGSI